MDDLASQHCTAIRKGARVSAGHVRWPANWIFGGVIGIALCVLLGIAIACAPAAVRSNNERCLQALAEEQHVSVEDFFQNPAGQDALAQAVTQCTR
ncbi:hypothetical protein LMG24238_03361 [Paraburkholderia sediminicola]|uniref:Uncharacterized protein n=1 Tax=Paraburkholderia sediminicola TaxID=458836 RepID=A0A6J5B889_9BURK|nr:hypothetical protein [Paraburkholderia sediminicola]CAB3695879.1 hypothetical protein LMG24238_03361 [Paraburkholderia sediminicola]